tara:strand:- start:933 stop:1631 length:699 start_codon:yes stop_codon:yes gene_type:complete
MKKITKKLLSSLGYEIKKKSNYFNFTEHNIDLVFDVGAHVGEFGTKIRESGYKGKIISFEPQTEIFLELKNVVKKDTNWILHPRCALGEKNKLENINILSETNCSSILKPNLKLFELDKSITKIRVEECNVYSLDYIINKYYSISKNTYLKIDTQGYDKNVLDGFQKNIEKIKFIQLEAGLYDLYEDEKLYEYYIEFFKSVNYELWDLKPFAYNKFGRLVQFDMIFKNIKVN